MLLSSTFSCSSAPLVIFPAIPTAHLTAQARLHTTIQLKCLRQLLSRPFREPLPQVRDLDLSPRSSLPLSPLRIPLTAHSSVALTPPYPASPLPLPYILNPVQKLYPLHLADKSWDNTGLLVDASNTTGSDTCKILLTVDLTRSVAAEAVEKNAGLVVAYHPFIFRGLKAITPADPQQDSLLRLIKNNVSVYCPHTAIDSARGGVNDFLADELVKHYVEESRRVIQPDKNEDGCGMGRLVTLRDAVALSLVVAAIKASLGLNHVQVAAAANSRPDPQIRTIAICAGSGGAVFRGVSADVFYTGELSHHEALYFVESGSSVVTCNHSNTERAFLQVLREQLRAELGDMEIDIAATDRDPYEIW